MKVEDEYRVEFKTVTTRRRVIPSKAEYSLLNHFWIPAFAGMTLDPILNAKQNKRQKTRRKFLLPTRELM